MSRHFCDLGNGDQQSAVRGIVVNLPCSGIYRSSVKSQESEFCPTEKQSETLPASGERERGSVEKNRGGEEWKGGEELESVSEGRKRKLRLTGYAIGFASMEEDFNS